MTASEIRQSFLDYFARHGHRVVASSSLVPGDDPTLLFTNAGMNQFKDVFLGTERRDYRRATTSQKCMRVSGKHNDLDNVGPSLRHHTFFEMLGNFSFGDYFKQDAIPFAWELLTREWQLPADRLFATVFKGDASVPRDDEAYEIWRGFLPAARIGELGAADNFWQMGETGPCGRCSEIYFHRGHDIPCGQEAAGRACRGLECDCDRYVEIWNNVFMEFDRQSADRLHPLPARSIDTGMGLDRITAVLQGKLSNYETDQFTPLLDAIARVARLEGLPSNDAERRRVLANDTTPTPVSARVIADHVRSMTFLIADGVVPSNEFRGYVLRKIMRRAMRHGKKLGMTRPFLYELVDVIVAQAADAYPELRVNREGVVRTVRAEEDRFDAVLTSGLPRLEELIDRTNASGASMVDGQDVFRLYDSLGVPLDFAEDLAGQRGLAIDRAAYEGAMEAQRERARASSAFETKKATGFEFTDDAERQRLERLPDQFEGYATTDVPQATVVALFDEQRHQVAALAPGTEGYVVLDRTPFYVESGGQVSDQGELRVDGATVATVSAMSRLVPSGVRVHRVIVSAAVAVGAKVDAVVHASRRDATRRNHTATHLLHAALRQALGSHVRQAGSLVAPDRLRFDFTHGQALTADERFAIEQAVNEQVYRNTPVNTEVKRTEDAIKAGAMALFGEKYGDSVRVVSIPGYSLELCGGTHVRATGDIGPFILLTEGGVASGVRRIEALTGGAAMAHVQALARTLDRTLHALGVDAAEAPNAVTRLQNDARRLTRENAQLKVKAALGGTRADEDDSIEVGDARLVTRRVSDMEKDALRALCDSLRDRIKRGVVVLASESAGKVQLLISVSKDLTDRIKAGQLVKELAPIVGGGGGGRPDFAEAGGKDASKMDQMLARARELVSAALQQPGGARREA